jgi:hypothetical protein
MTEPLNLVAELPLEFLDHEPFGGKAERPTP